MSRILSIDYGRARIGVAHSDERKWIASPLCVIKAQKKPLATANDLLSKIGHLLPLEKIIVGLPLLLNGQEGEMAKEAKAFAEKLKEVCQVPIVFWDERLTSMQAERLLKEDNKNRKQRAQCVDTLSAVLILQNYLDAQALVCR